MHDRYIIYLVEILVDRMEKMIDEILIDVRKITDIVAIRKIIYRLGECAQDEFTGQKEFLVKL
jgi:hypothetical protein